MTGSTGIAVLVLAAEEPSKAPFYIAGGALAVWAVVASAIGIVVRPAMGGALAWIVMAVTAVLMVGAIGTAIGTAGEGEAEGQQKSSPEEEGTAKEPSAAGGGAAPLRLAADPGGSSRFDKKALSAKAGRVTIELRNPAPVAHNVAIEGKGKEVVKSETVSGGARATAEAELKAGRYTFFCAVPGHREGGMEGTLTVE